MSSGRSSRRTATSASSRRALDRILEKNGIRMWLKTRRGREGLAGKRLVVGSVVGIAAAITAAAAGAQWQVALSIGWCALAVVVLVWIWATIGTKDSKA